MQHCDDEVIALAALGEQPGTADTQHLAGCAECQSEVDSLRSVVSAVRVPVGPGQAVPPPQRVWSEIATATGVGVSPRPAAVTTATTVTKATASGTSGEWSVGEEGPGARMAPGADTGVDAVSDGNATVEFRPRRSARYTWRSMLAVAASALLIGAAGGVLGGAVLREDPKPAKPTVVTQVVLAALPVDPGARGEASVLTTNGDRQLAVDVSSIGRTDGFYEVWLIDRNVKRMIPLGILHSDRGEFAIPPGVDLGQYPIIDVSAEPLDGDPTHSGKSLLRGTISG